MLTLAIIVSSWIIPAVTKDFKMIITILATSFLFLVTLPFGKYKVKRMLVKQRQKLDKLMLDA
jgi:hypothetical protein